MDLGEVGKEPLVFTNMHARYYRDINASRNILEEGLRMIG